MAIDSITGKMVLQRATDVVRDTSAQQRQAEIALKSALLKTQDEVERMRSEVMDVYKPEEAIIQRESEHSGQSASNNSRKRKKRGNSQPEEQLNEAMPNVGETITKIDILI